MTHADLTYISGSSGLYSAAAFGDGRHDMTQLKLQILGGFQLIGTDGQPCQLPTRKAEAVLAYLALPLGRAHRRDHLSALLWGTRGQKQARHSLNQTIFSIRKAVGLDPIQVHGEGLVLDRELIAVDADQFQHLAAAQDPASDAEIAAIYQGDLLAGLNLREEVFEEWLISERIRLREVALAALNRLLQSQIARGEYEAAVQTALRLLAIDPLQEMVHRDLMRVYTEQGRHGAALRQYEVCEATLQRELGAAPQPETQALQRMVAEQRLRRRPPATPSPTVEEPAPENAPVSVVPQDAQHVIQPERKHLTVLCFEIEAQSDASQDPETTFELLDPAMNAASEAIRHYLGTISIRQSHTLTALFGAPVAYEDHAVRACYASLAIQDAIKRESAGRMHARIGLHSGEVVVRPADADGDTRYDAVGNAVGLAGRIQRSVPPGAIGLSATTRRQALEYIETEPVTRDGTNVADDGDGVFLLTQRSAVTRPWQARLARGLTTFVGREAELATLNQAVNRTETGEGQLVAVIGNPGVGKSRLVHELAKSRSLTDWTVLAAGASSLETTTAFGVVSQMLRSWLDVEDRHSQADIAAKARQAVFALDRAVVAGAVLAARYPRR